MKLLKLLLVGATLLGSVSSYVLPQSNHLQWRYGTSPPQAQAPPPSMYPKNKEGTVLSLKFNVDKHDDGDVYDQKTGKKIGKVHVDCQDSCALIRRDNVPGCVSQCKVDITSCEEDRSKCITGCSKVCPICCKNEANMCVVDCNSKFDTCVEKCGGDKECQAQCKDNNGMCVGMCKAESASCGLSCREGQCEPNCTPCQKERDDCLLQCDDEFIECLPPCVQACLETGEVDSCSLKFQTTSGYFDITGSFESLKTLVSEKDSCQVSGECEIEACLNCESDSGITTKYDSMTRSTYELEIVSLFGTTCPPPNSNDVKNEPIFFLDVEFGKEKYRSLKHSGYDYNNQPQPQYGYQQPITYNSYQQPMMYPQQPITYQQQPSGYYVNHVQPVYTQQQPFQHQPVGYNNYHSGYSNQQQYVAMYQPATYGQ